MKVVSSHLILGHKRLKIRGKLERWKMDYRELKCAFISHVWRKLSTGVWLNWTETHPCFISITWNDTHTQWLRELLALSGCIPSCHPHCHRVRSLGWLVHVIRPISHYTHTQGERFTQAQRRNLSILLSVHVRCAFSVSTVATQCLILSQMDFNGRRIHAWNPLGCITWFSTKCSDINKCLFENLLSDCSPH